MARRETIERAVRKSPEWQATLAFAREKLGFDPSWGLRDKLNWLFDKDTESLDSIGKEALRTLRLSPDAFGQAFWQDFGLKEFLPPDDGKYGRWLAQLGKAFGLPHNWHERREESGIKERIELWLKYMDKLLTITGDGPRFARASLRFALVDSVSPEIKEDSPIQRLLEEGRLSEVAEGLQRLGPKLRTQFEERLEGKPDALWELVKSMGLANPIRFSIEGSVATANRDELISYVDRVIAFRKLWEDTIGAHFLSIRIHKAKLPTEHSAYDDDTKRYQSGELSFTDLLRQEWGKPETQQGISLEMEPSGNQYRRADVLKRAKTKVYYRVRARLAQRGLRVEAEPGWRDTLEFPL